MIVAAVGLALGSVLGYAVAILAAMFPRVGKGGLSVSGHLHPFRLLRWHRL